MITIKDLQRKARTHGATVEEDCGYRNMRVFQVVAPTGQRWSANDSIHIRVEISRGTNFRSWKFNQRAWADFTSRIEFGLEPIPESEAYLYTED